MQVFSTLFQFFSTLFQFMAWILKPSVIPWAGALAAIIASLTVEPRNWLRIHVRGVGRALRVAAVWLLVAWMISFTSMCVAGSGGGNGGTNGGTGSPGAPPAPPSPHAPPTVPPEHFPSDVPEHVDLVVCFVPSRDDGSRAEKFSCNLFPRFRKREDSPIPIRATNMDEFSDRLNEELRNLVPSPPEEPWTVLIERSPNPGESVLRRVEGNVKAALPKASLERR